MAASTSTRRGTSDVLEQYLKDVRPIRLLTADEEKVLGGRVQAGREARQRIKRSNLSSASVGRLQMQIRDADRARDELVMHNMRLVISVARQYQNRGLPLSDLIQEGNIGLVKAADKFDIGRGVRFATHAVWWIRQSVTRALSNKSRTIRLPIQFAQRASELFRTRERLEQDLGREPTVDELSVALKWPVSKVRHMLTVSQPPLDLDAKHGAENSDDELVDFVADESLPQPEHQTTDIMLNTQLAELLDELPANEARVLRMRFGLADGHAHSLSEIGRRMGLSRERVRQINNAALNALRESAVRHNLRDYLLA
ncbi:MAG TPA: sigma-70 family RNA polymerase sigma factor [Anaerolineae bacterium]|nr:sigma-70 family RNA polymerase sigma factor [Anaerolineae bacterium]